MKIKLTNASFQYRKLVLKIIMRTLVFLFCTTIFAFTPSDLVSQNSKIKIKEAKTLTVDEVFDLIMMQTDFNFFYEKGIFKDFPNVHLKKGIIRTNDLLAKSLAPGGLDIEVAPNNTIIIKESTKTSKQQEHEVSGIVTDQSGQPLPGANIIEKGTTNGVTADFDGKFFD